MQVGDQVRVKESVVIYHHPEHRNNPFDIKGTEGELIQVIKDWQGREVSANYPYLVKFSKKLRIHLGEHEIESV
ncbi:ferredoxin-thioredoxin reductase variable chain [Acaryochloris sp. 'Moss Beach']|uniref:ferredoxin-thioredoxin reductase variable chain n=1 Tax=Acaryochloris TaxID=155977 RepID=UPI001BAEC09B|nr:MULTISPECIES: ferredoxin-thioredoxin reductase variable chain [Acaryochloris]QUY41301.1 ferredoxin-thioredoxin reductase variable chain [Acaryochloris marina S15]UJB70473.1 ferredoxin-thioredoxin reductase variable chain [Acaryochloris sp. 'Moss Beach']